MAEKNRYARYRFQVKKGDLMCIGQRQTRRGTYYPAKMVTVPLAGKTPEDMKKAMAAGVAELNDES